MELKLTRLSCEAGVHLLQTLGVRRESGTQANFEKLVEDVKGHALTLQIIGGFLKRAFQGDIRRRDRVKFEIADEKIDGGHAFRAMDAYVQWMDGESDEANRELAILRLMGLFDRPATDDCLKALLKLPAIVGLTEPLAGLAEDDWHFSLDALGSANLLTVNRDASGEFLSIDTHPHIREYFAKQLRKKNSAAWRTAHRRLYEHLCATTQEGDHPTLEDLQPLYQAVAHGCQAGLQQDASRVYYFRIAREREAYAVRQLGAFGSVLGAVACFFESPWSRVSPALSEADQAWLLNEASYCLRAVGRLTEALEPVRAGAEMRIKQEEWGQSARSASNLGELELTLGELVEALEDAEQSVIYADRCGDMFLGTVARAKVGLILHQSGRWTEATQRFRDAERMQAKRQTAFPLLYSLQGFRYCDFLLAAPERAAWQTIFSFSLQPSTVDSAVSDCRSVSQRAKKMFEWRAPEDSLLDIALDHLTLGRTSLYEAIVDPSNSDFATAISEINAAVDGLRRAASQDRIPNGLLTRAWLRGLTGALTGSTGSPQAGPESAQEDLDEAWEIATRGSMRLFMADIHLYRARLFFRQAFYPWDKNDDGSPRGPRDDLAAARKLIEQCGYWRRKEELEDAELAILGSVKSSQG